MSEIQTKLSGFQFENQAFWGCTNTFVWIGCATFILKKSDDYYLSEINFLWKEVSVRAEIHQPLLSHFSLLVEFFIGQVPVNNKDSRVLRLVNLSPEIQTSLDFGQLASVRFIVRKSAEIPNSLI